MLSSWEESFYSCRSEALGCRLRVRGLLTVGFFKFRLLQP